MTELVQNTTTDLSFVGNPARIAVYDDLLSSPQIINIPPDSTRNFIGNLASSIYKASQEAGGKIPYTIIEQVSENFIHSYFTEMVVSVLDNGNTLRFSDQGPGISDKEKAQEPGFSSATSQMKEYIHGVGSGLPIVREYLELKNGTIKIEDNLNQGAVITISLEEKNKENIENDSKRDQKLLDKEEKGKEISPTQNKESIKKLVSLLSKRSVSILYLFNTQDVLGVSDISNDLNIAKSSVHSELKKLEQQGIVMQVGTKRVLTDLGQRVLDYI